MRELVGSVVLMSLLGCAGPPLTGAPVEQAPPSRIGGFLQELVGYLGRRDLVDVGDPAPDFSLTPLRFYDFARGEHSDDATADPYRPVRLSSFAGKRPVALVFGSYT